MLCEEKSGWVETELTGLEAKVLLACQLTLKQVYGSDPGVAVGSLLLVSNTSLLVNCCTACACVCIIYCWAALTS